MIEENTLENPQEFFEKNDQENIETIIENSNESPEEIIDENDQALIDEILQLVEENNQERIDENLQVVEENDQENTSEVLQESSDEIDQQNAINNIEKNSQHLKMFLEAALLASDQPLSVEQLRHLIEENDRPAAQEIREALTILAHDCENRGVELVEVASGFRFQIKAQFSPRIGKLWEERPPRYSRALLETLALIAYRQPITRAEIEDIRGVVVSTHIIKILLEREWIRVVGYRDVPGRPGLYATTKQFLDYFNMKSLSELPTLTEIQNLDHLADQLQNKENTMVAQIAQIEHDDKVTQNNNLINVDEVDTLYNATLNEAQELEHSLNDGEMILEVVENESSNDDVEIMHEQKENEVDEENEIKVIEQMA